MKRVVRLAGDVFRFTGVWGDHLVAFAFLYEYLDINVYEYKDL